MSEGRKDQEREVARRRRIAEAFGDALPERTRDESAEGWGDSQAKGGAGDDDWLRSQVPPHHG